MLAGTCCIVFGYSLLDFFITCDSCFVLWPILLATSHWAQTWVWSLFFRAKHWYYHNSMKLEGNVHLFKTFNRFVVSTAYGFGKKNEEMKCRNGE